MNQKRSESPEAARLAGDDLRMRLALLKQSTVLAGLDESVLADLAGKATVVDLAPGEAVFRKGEASDSMYFIAKGCIRIHDGDYVFTQLAPPQSFGEYALIHDSLRTASATASATACEATTLLKLDRMVFQQHLRDNCEFLHSLLQSMFKRIVEKDFTEEQINWNREELRRQRDELERQRQQLTQMNAVKDKFFSIIAHDLKSPLMALSMMSRALSERPGYLTPEKAQEYARLVHESAMISCRLMENLLDWSRMQTNSIAFVMEPVDLHRTVCENFALLDICARHKRITLSSEVPENVRVLADARSVSAIVRNLVSNAVKYTPEGGRVAVTAVPGEKHVEWSVTDSGVGIEPRRLDEVFRIDVSSSTRGTADELGTGLGLKLCKEFVERNRGVIQMTSEVGKGTKVTVTLPRA